MADSVRIDAQHVDALRSLTRMALRNRSLCSPGDALHIKFALAFCSLTAGLADVIGFDFSEQALRAESLEDAGLEALPANPQAHGFEPADPPTRRIYDRLRQIGVASISSGLSDRSGGA